MMSWFKKLSIRKKIFLILTVVILLLPVEVACGNLWKSCAMPPINGGTARYHYEVKPLIFTILQMVTGVDIPFYYSSGVYETK